MSEQALRDALERVLDTLDAYSDAKFFGSGDDDDDMDRIGRRVDRAVASARKLLKKTAPKSPC